MSFIDSVWTWSTNMTSRRDQTNKAAVIRKYNRTSRDDIDPLKKMRPSEFYGTPPNLNLDDYPKIIELNIMSESTAQLQSSVVASKPLFQSSSKAIVFEDYAPFSVHEKKLFFRNNDSVSYTLFQPNKLRAHSFMTHTHFWHFWKSFCVASNQFYQWIRFSNFTVFEFFNSPVAYELYL